MAFRGNIPKGSHVRATLSVDNQAAGSALLSLAFVDNGGGQDAQSTTVAPGGTDSVSVQTNPEPTGLVRVVVDFNDNGDSGHLTVHVDGALHDQDRITGDTTWSYSLA